MEPVQEGVEGALAVEEGVEQEAGHHLRQHPRGDDDAAGERTDRLGGALDERFDIVFWSSNYVLAPDDYSYRSPHEQAYVDPGYRTHRRYLEEAPLRVTPTGSALLHFSDRGDVPALYRIADECGRELRLLDACRVRECEYGDDTVEHLLFEIAPRTA
ncbi:hypothetical protein SALBM311S_09579 [Streptomyces alboniger]